MTSTLKRFRDTGFERVFAADDRFVDLGAAGHVVRLHGQDFLQRVGGAIGFERPDFHFAETLAAELRLAAQRLLGDERVRTDRTRMDLVVHQMVQLQHVDVADRDRARERLAGAAVDTGSPAPTEVRPACSSMSTMSCFLGAVEHRRCDGNARTQIVRQLHQAVLVDLAQTLVIAIDAA